MALRKITLTSGALGIALAIAFAAVHDNAAPPAQAADITTPDVPRAALLATHPGAELTSLFFVDARANANLAPVATFGHLPDATVRAVVLPGKNEILATADTTPTQDASFNASLFYLRAHTPAVRLVDRVVHASTPLVTSAGRIFVSRGEPGKDIDGQLRVDSLTIDEIDLATGKPHTLHQTNGYLLYLAGALDKEIIVYRIVPNRADIMAIDTDTGKERFIFKNLPPFARDFSIDPQKRTIVFQNRDENDSGTWVVDRVEIATGKTQRLYSGSSMTLAPFTLPQGGVLYNPPGNGLSALEGHSSISGPLGEGVDVVAGMSPDGRYLAALHTLPSAFGVPFVVETQSGRARVLAAPANTRVVLAGFVVEGGAP
jgi:hypothetical protein